MTDEPATSPDEPQIDGGAPSDEAETVADGGGPSSDYSDDDEPERDAEYTGDPDDDVPFIREDWSDGSLDGVQDDAL